MIHSTILCEAELELREAVSYYESKNYGLGIDFLLEVESGLEAIRSFPNQCSLRKDGTRRYLIHCFPYFIIYVYQNDHIWVIAFAHCKRKPEYWNKRINM
jgi:toxin ParE1/3/4